MKTEIKTTTKQQRVEIVNEIIKEIASRGRKFLHYNGVDSKMELRNGRIYFLQAYKEEWMCFSTPMYSRPKKWASGGTMLGLIKDFTEFIKTGKYSNHKNGYGGLYCPHWGYSVEDMKAIQAKAISLGYLIEGQIP